MFLRFLILISVALMPLVLLVEVLGGMSAVGYLDYWTAVHQLLGSEAQGYALGRIAIRLNEHVIPVTGLIYLLNIDLFGGDNRVLALVGLIAVLLQMICFFRMLPVSLRKKLSTASLLLLVLSLFLFSPVAYANWYEGFSATHWYVAQLFVILSIASFVRYHTTESSLWFFCACLSGILGCFTFSSAYIVWPALISYALYVRMDRKKILVLLCLMFLVFSLGYLLAYTSFYEVTHHPERGAKELIYNPLTFASYFFFYFGAYFFPLGYLMQSRALWSVLIGALGFLVLLGLFFWGWRNRRETYAPWFSIFCYAICNDFLTCLLRGSHGFGMIAGSRYKTTSGILWIVLAVLLLSFLYERYAIRKYRRLFLICMFLLFAGGHFAVYRLHKKEIRIQQYRAQARDLAALSYQLDLYDTKLITKMMTHNIKQLRALRPLLRDAQHIPFRDRCPEHVSYKDILPTDNLQNKILSVKLTKSVVGGRRILLRSDYSDLPERLCLFSESGSLKGVVLHRRFFNLSSFKNGSDLRWNGYVREDALSETLSVLVRDGGTSADSYWRRVGSTSFPS